jgi:hypothetical protein
VSLKCAYRTAASSHCFVGASKSPLSFSGWDAGPSRAYLLLKFKLKNPPLAALPVGTRALARRWAELGAGAEERAC